MPRRPTYLKKSVKLQVEGLERKCRYCKTHQSGRGFDKHEAWCKKTWIIRQELQDLRRHSTAKQLQAEPTPLISPIILSNLDGNNEFVEGSSSMMPMEVEYPSPEPGPRAPVTAPSLECMLTLSQVSLVNVEWEIYRLCGHVRTSFTTGIHQSYSPSPFSEFDHPNTCAEYLELSRSFGVFYLYAAA